MMIGIGMALTLPRGGGTAFSPLTLFSSGEPGAWFDLSDLSTLYQDSAGTVPVTAAGQPVGLVLDKSRGLVLGPELVTNGGFDSGLEGWVKGPGTGNPISWEPSRLVLTNDLAYYAAAVQTITGLTVGRWYELSGDYVSATGSPVSRINVVLLAGGTAAGTPGGAGKLILRFAATATSHQIAVSHGTNTLGQVSYFDNISIRELPGNHATQPVAASRPTLGRHPVGGRRNGLLSTNDLSVASWIRSSVSSVSPVTSPDANLAWTVTTSGTDGAIFQGDRVTPGTVKTHQVRVKAGTSATFRFQETVAGNGAYVDFNLSAITSGSPVTVGTGGVTISSATIVDEGDGWRLCSITATRTSGTSGNFFLVVVGASGSTMTFRMPQAEAGSTATPYQRVDSAYDVTEAGNSDCWYLYTDPADDALTVTVPAGGWANATIALALATGVTILTGQTIQEGTWTLPLPRPSNCYGMVVVNRALTVAETAQLTKWLDAKRGV